MYTHENNISLVLGIPGIVIQVAGKITGLMPLTIAGSVLLIAGLGFYAMAKERSPAWGLLGLLSILGIIILAFLKDESIDEADPPKPSRKPDPTRKPIVTGKANKAATGSHQHRLLNSAPAPSYEPSPLAQSNIKKEWYYMDGQFQQGPLSENVMGNLIRQRMISADTLVFKEGFAEKIPLKDCEDLQKFFVNRNEGKRMRPEKAPKEVRTNYVLFAFGFLFSLGGVIGMLAHIIKLIRWGGTEVHAFNPISLILMIAGIVLLKKS